MRVATIEKVCSLFACRVSGGVTPSTSLRLTMAQTAAAGAAILAAVVMPACRTTAVWYQAASCRLTGAKQAIAATAESLLLQAVRRAAISRLMGKIRPQSTTCRPSPHPWHCFQVRRCHLGSRRHGLRGKHGLLHLVAAQCPSQQDMHYHPALPP